jgi:hypothetical protein
MLDLFPLTVVLTLQTALQPATPTVTEGLLAPLVIQWE